MNWQGLIDEHLNGRHEPILLYLEEDRREQIAKAIAEHDPQVVVAVGGDGTVNLVATVIGGTGRPMGIIPAGSANGLATELKIPADHIEALELLISNEPRAVDAILVNDDDLCIHLSDLGLNARLIKYFDETPARGMFTYARLSLKVLFRKERFKVKVRTESEELLRSVFMVVIANARKYGTGATINKEGAIDDGFFELVFVRKFDLRDLWTAIRENERFDPKRIEVVSAREVEITMKRSVHFQVDGDHKGRTRYVRAKILPAHLRIIHTG